MPVPSTVRVLSEVMASPAFPVSSPRLVITGAAVPLESRMVIGSAFD